MEDLAPALLECGINVQKPEYYADSYASGLHPQPSHTDQDVFEPPAKRPKVPLLRLSPNEQIFHFAFIM